jgi:hypothetical protein
MVSTAATSLRAAADTAVSRHSRGENSSCQLQQLSSLSDLLQRRDDFLLLALRNPRICLFVLLTACEPFEDLRSPGLFGKTDEVPS